MSTKPEDKLDAILTRGETPEIWRVMDCRKWRYVCPEYQPLWTPYGTVKLQRGRFYDGSSGPKLRLGFGIEIDLAKDLQPLAFAAHDDLFRYPYTYRAGVKMRMSFYEINQIYRYILEAHGYKRAGRLRCWTLMLFGWKQWRKYRKAEFAGELHQAEFFVPKEESWDFPSWKMRDARWIG